MSRKGHEIIGEWSKEKGVAIEPETVQQFMMYAALIHETSKNFNLTGFKTEEEIIINLILGSVEPLCDINVPRGTSFVDIGSGAGVPGVILGLFFDEISGLLVEANHKKADFIAHVIDEFKLEKIKVVCDRVENAARQEEYREAFDWCFARAFGSHYVSLELGAPFVRRGGHFYVYSGGQGDDLPNEVLDHAGETGLSIMSHSDRGDLSVAGTGLLFRKEEPIPEKFPRRFAVIKREAERIGRCMPG